MEIKKMKRKKNLSILLGAVLILSIFSATGLAEDNQNVETISQNNNNQLGMLDIDLTPWTPLYHDFNISNETVGEWIINPNTLATQTKNCDPCFLLHPDTRSQWSVASRFKINSLVDDDWIGFTFGFQNMRQFYIMDWHTNLTNENKQEGFSIKKINAPSVNDLGMQHFKNYADTTDGISDVLDDLYGKGRGWYFNYWYDFSLYFNNGDITVTVMNGTTTLYNTFIAAGAGAYTSGRFGFYACSQADVSFKMLGTPDQTNPKCEDCKYVENYAWQQFVPKGDRLIGLELSLAQWFGGSPDLEIRIEKPLGSAPLSRAVIPASDVPEGACDWISIALWPHITLQKGATYYIVVEYDLGGEYSWCGAYGDPYPPGISDIDPDWDWTFKTIVDKSKAKVLNTPFLDILESHPNIFPILQMLLQRLGLQ
jgi:hypothetical protein